MRWEILLRALGLVARTGSSGLVLGAATGLWLCAGGAFADTQGPLPMTAALPPATQTFGPEAAIPQPLEAVDASRYRQIFRLQDKGDWRAADAVIGDLTDLRLLGHVLAQRYLHPDYRSRYVELAAWLAKYSDHPEAPAIYRLAMKRLPAGTPAPTEPELSSFRGGTPDSTAGLDETHYWKEALAAWRKGDTKTAAGLFEAAAKASGGSNPWLQAAAAYWAARCHVRNHEPEEVSEWLRLAAAEPRTFYGQLARRALGIDTAFAWATPQLTVSSAEALMSSRAGQRALALIQVGQPTRAGAEFQVLRANATPELAQGMLAVAERLHFPSLTIALGVSLEGQSGFRFDNALFPMPDWQPKGGYSINRALLFAFARQESGFNPEAKSPVGALGVMQLMPHTLKAMNQRLTDTLGASKRVDWRDPEVSLALGQEYIQYLLEDDDIQGDLILLAAAYNAGPNKLAKWRAELGYDSDPLLFIESMPARETRNFVQRVLASMWIYQQKLGQASPSLDALAAGAWPGYFPQQDLMETAAETDVSY
jgi:peptidoglycan lytic transglycosylase